MKVAGRTEILQPEFIVEPYLGGVRVDSFLSRHLRNYTTWRLHRLVSAGLCWINDLPADPDQRVRRGQVVRIRLAEPPDKLLSQSSASVPILYEDPWLLVVNKPAGMVAHPVGDYQENTLTNVLQRHLDNQTSQRGLLRAGWPHAPGPRHARRRSTQRQRRRLFFCHRSLPTCRPSHRRRDLRRTVWRLV